MPTCSPLPPAIFVGRNSEQQRLVDGLARVTLAIVVGDAGAGKSALAYQLARSWPSRTRYTRCGDGNAMTELDDAIAELESTSGLWIIDDVDTLSVADQVTLVSALGHGLVHARAVLTSRELVPVSRLALDRLELRLGGLDEAAARELWTELDLLYGESPGFADAWLASQGNPLQLRRAHGRDRDSAPADPVIVDARNHEIRHGELKVSLATRPAQRELLYALAEQPNLPVAKSDLVRALWATSYRAGHHDAPLKMNVQRLRVALEPTTLVIETVPGGYLLRAPDRFGFHRPNPDASLPRNPPRIKWE